MSKQRLKFDLLVHDLKVPLAVIEAGATSLLKRMEKYGPLTDKQIKVMNRILRNTINTKRLVNDALELGRSSEGIIHKNQFLVSDFIEESLVEIFDLTDSEAAESIKDCANLTASKQALESRGIFLEIDEGLWCRKISLDESKIKQVLRNLLNNALKYRKNRIELTLQENDNALQISVADDGDGIPADYHERIFECYFQMDMEEQHCVRGHGLGLAGVMILVEDMGGTLNLESDLGQGTLFTVKVPY